MGYEYCFEDNQETEEPKVHRLDIERLGALLYNERRIMFERFEKLKRGKLENMDLSELNEELSEISDKSKFVDRINAAYSHLVEMTSPDLAGKTNALYEQYKRFSKKVIEFLSFGIMNRTSEGDYR